jgi:hypothetical protein
LSLPHLRQELLVDTFGDVDYNTLEEVAARAIRGHNHKWILYKRSFSEATFHIVLSALATLPCLEFVKLRRDDVSEGSHFERPEALKNNAVTVSSEGPIYFLGPLSRALGGPSGRSNVAWLCFDCCSIP